MRKRRIFTERRIDKEGCSKGGKHVKGKRRKYFLERETLYLNSSSLRVNNASYKRTYRTHLLEGCSEGFSEGYCSEVPGFEVTRLYLPRFMEFEFQARVWFNQILYPVATLIGGHHNPEFLYVECHFLKHMPLRGDGVL